MNESFNCLKLNSSSQQGHASSKTLLQQTFPIINCVCQLTHFDRKIVVVVVVFNLLKFQERSTSISRVEENLWPYWVSLHAPQAHSRWRWRELVALPRMLTCSWPCRSWALAIQALPLTASLFLSILTLWWAGSLKCKPFGFVDQLFTG